MFRPHPHPFFPQERDRLWQRREHDSEILIFIIDSNPFLDFGDVKDPLYTFNHF